MTLLFPLLNPSLKDKCHLSPRALMVWQSSCNAIDMQLFPLKCLHETDTETLQRPIRDTFYVVIWFLFYQTKQSLGVTVRLTHFVFRLIFFQRRVSPKIYFRSIVCVTGLFRCPWFIDNYYWVCCYKFNTTWMCLSLPARKNQLCYEYWTRDGGWSSSVINLFLYTSQWCLIFQETIWVWGLSCTFLCLYIDAYFLDLDPNNTACSETIWALQKATNRSKKVVCINLSLVMAKISGVPIYMKLI